MPIYEYRCIACEKVFARLQRMGASAEEVRCPECGSEQVNRLVSAFSSSTGGAVGSLGSPASPGCGGGGFT